MDSKYGGTIVALVLNACEHLTFLSEEVEYIWQHPWRLRTSSWMFIFTRYGTYLMHILNAIYPDPDPDPTLTIHSHKYRDFLVISFRIVTSSSITFVIHFALAKRLTLFYRGIWVRLFILPGFLIARISIVLTSISILYHRMLLQDAMYIGSIEVIMTHTGGEFLLESLMLVFMAIAHFAAISCRRNPLAYRLRRVEGVGVPGFALIALIMTTIMQAMDQSKTTMIFSLYVSVMSALACRLILSNHRAIHGAPPAEYRLVSQRL